MIASKRGVFSTHLLCFLFNNASPAVLAVLIFLNMPLFGIWVELEFKLKDHLA